MRGRWHAETRAPKSEDKDRNRQKDKQREMQKIQRRTDRNRSLKTEQNMEQHDSNRFGQRVKRRTDTWCRRRGFVYKCRREWIRREAGARGVVGGESEKPWGHSVHSTEYRSRLINLNPCVARWQSRGIQTVTKTQRSRVMEGDRAMQLQNRRERNNVEFARSVGGKTEKRQRTECRETPRKTRRT